MKKLICILASTALLGACEQKSDVAPTSAKKAEDNASSFAAPPKSETGERAKTTDPKTLSRALATAASSEMKTEATNALSTAATPVTSTEMKTETLTTETKTDTLSTESAPDAKTETKIESTTTTTTTSSPTP